MQCTGAEIGVPPVGRFKRKRVEQMRPEGGRVRFADLPHKMSTLSIFNDCRVSKCRPHFKLLVYFMCYSFILAALGSRTWAWTVWNVGSNPQHIDYGRQNRHCVLSP